jgi:hypothetical protein
LLKTLQLLNYLKYPQPHQQFSKENKGLLKWMMIQELTSFSFSKRELKRQFLKPKFKISISHKLFLAKKCLTDFAFL